MTELLARFDDWSDRLSPIVVKEVRQMVRGREFNYAFGLSLVVGLIVAFFGLADALTSSGTAGSRVFAALMVCLGVLGLAVVPLGAFNGLRNERVDQTFDLITQTALTPRRIVIGKLITQGVKLIILFAGLAPFMAMSFLLGGIDLLTILLSLGMLFLWSMWVCSACLFMSSASQSRAMSGVLFVGMIIGAVMLVVGFAPFMMSVIGVVGVPRPPGNEMWWVIGGSTALALVSMTNFVLLAENRLALPIEDRSTALRVGFFVQFLLILACACAPLFAVASGAPGYGVSAAVTAIRVIGIFGGLQLALSSVFAVTEDMVLSRRVFRRIQPSLKWPWVAVFRPGGGRGAAWILMQMLVMLVLAGALSSGSEVTWVLGICSYILFFTGVPTAVLRRLLKANARIGFLRVAILLFFPIVAISADLFLYFLTPKLVFDGSYSFYHILNPFRTLYSWNQVIGQGWAWAVMVMGLIGLLCYLDLIRMGQREDQRAGAQH
jgi:hypothetical protein